MLAALYAVCNETHVKSGLPPLWRMPCFIQCTRSYNLRRHQRNTAMLERQLTPTSTNVDSHSGLYANRHFSWEAASHLCISAAWLKDLYFADRTDEDIKICKQQKRTPEHRELLNKWNKRHYEHILGMRLALFRMMIHFVHDWVTGTQKCYILKNCSKPFVLNEIK